MTKITLERAIGELQDGKDGTVAMLKAKRLGIEAMERIRELRAWKTRINFIHEPLPSEGGKE